MVDFNKIRQDNLNRATNKVLQDIARAPVTPAKAEPKPIATDRDRDEDISALEILASKFRSKLSEKERGFCDGNLLRMRKYQYAALTVAQAKWLDNMWNRCVPSEKDDDPLFGRNREVPLRKFDLDKDDIPF
jgi:hypothetical protein